MSERILFFGDSVTEGGRDYQNDASMGNFYPLLVMAELGFQDPLKYEFINKGIRGNRIVDLYTRTKQDVLVYHPDYLSIMIGVNDAWHFYNNNDFEKIHCMMIEEFWEKLPDTKIMILGPFVTEGNCIQNTAEHPDCVERMFNDVSEKSAIAQRVAQKYGLPFAELQSKFTQACKIAPASYWTKDGLHSTPLGNELIKREWLRCFFEHFNKNQ